MSNAHGRRCSIVDWSRLAPFAKPPAAKRLAYFADLVSDKLGHLQPRRLE